MILPNIYRRASEIEQQVFKKVRDRIDARVELYEAKYMEDYTVTLPEVDAEIDRALGELCEDDRDTLEVYDAFFDVKIDIVSHFRAHL